MPDIDEAHSPRWCEVKSKKKWKKHCQIMNKQLYWSLHRPEEDAEDEIRKSMLARGKQDNLVSGFTATQNPKQSAIWTKG
jgi:type I restriction enzyme R subunit